MIKVKIKFCAYETIITDEVTEMVILYKKPGSLFWKKLKHHISSVNLPYEHPRFGQENLDYYQEVEAFITDMDKIKKIAKEKITANIMAEQKDDKISKDIKSVHKLIKGKVIEFEFEEKK